MAKKKTAKAAPQPVILENGALLVYSYHPVTGEYIGTDQAFADPLTPGEYLIPGGATTVEPPQTNEAEFARWDGTQWVKEPVPQPAPQPEPTTEELAAAARAQRNGLLYACDWTQLGDVPISDELQSAWVDYRQALRDVPQQENFPTEIVWPTAP